MVDDHMGTQTRQLTPHGDETVAPASKKQGSSKVKVKGKVKSRGNKRASQGSSFRPSRVPPPAARSPAYLEPGSGDE